MVISIRTSHDAWRGAVSQSRRGTSLVEFVGCFAALVGGLALGSLYLGVDLKSYGLSALKSAGVIEPAEAPAAIAEGPSAAMAKESLAPEAPGVAPPTSAVVAAAFEASVAPTPSVEASPVQPAAAHAPIKELSLQEVAALTDEQRQAITAAYWTAIAQCMQDEVDHRTTGIRDSGNLQLFDYLTTRSEGHAAAAKQIAELSTLGVDPHVRAYAEKARAWHEEGAKLYGRALDLLTDAPSAQLSGPFVQSWQSAATQHRMEETLLQEKHAAVETYLNHATTPAVAGPGA